MEDLDAASLEDVHAFFRRVLRPQQHRPHPRRRPHAGGRVRRRGAVLRRRCRPAPSRPASTVDAARAADRAGARRAHRGRAQRPAAPRLPAARSTTPTSSSPPRWRSTSSAAWRPPGWCRGWSAASRSPSACRPTPWGSSTGCRWASSCIDVADGAERRRGRGRRRRGAASGFAEEGPTDVELESVAGPDRAVLALRAGQPGGARRPDLPPRAAARATPACVNTFLDRLRDGDGGRHPAGCRTRGSSPRRGPSSPTCEPSTKEPPHDPALTEADADATDHAAAAAADVATAGCRAPGGCAAAVDLPRRRPRTAGQRAARSSATTSRASTSSRCAWPCPCPLVARAARA